jgi:hypothetical protein
MIYISGMAGKFKLQVLAVIQNNKKGHHYMYIYE